MAADFLGELLGTMILILLKGGAGWDYAPIPVVGPLIGAALAGIAVVALRI